MENLIETLTELFSEHEENPQFSEPKWNPNGNGVMYVEFQHPEYGNARIRCKLANRLGDVSLVSAKPMKRFNENSAYPWDSTIKSVYTVFSSIPGVSGVANRGVNRSLI